MKKYSTKHLEKIPPEFIAALEKTLEMIRNSNCGSSSCPNVIEHKGIFGYYSCSEKNALCPKYIKYRVNLEDSPCPCWKYGKNKSAKIIENLITQWKAWAQITD